MSPGKRKSRELAMQVLYLWDAHGSDDPLMARQAMENVPGADDAASRRSTGTSCGWGSGR